MSTFMTVNNHGRIKAVVVKQCKEPRSYIVESEGVQYRRNQKHLSKNSEPCVPNDIPEKEIFDPSNDIPQEEILDPPNEDLPYKTRSIGTYISTS